MRCCATCGNTTRRLIRAQWTRTCDVCARSSARRRNISIRCGEWGIGLWSELLETSNIEHPTSKAESTAGAGHWMFDVGCWVLDVFLLSTMWPALTVVAIAA